MILMFAWNTPTIQLETMENNWNALATWRSDRCWTNSGQNNVIIAPSSWTRLHYVHLMKALAASNPSLWTIHKNVKESHAVRYIESFKDLHRISLEFQAMYHKGIGKNLQLTSWNKQTYQKPDKPVIILVMFFLAKSPFSTIFEGEISTLYSIFATSIRNFLHL